MNDRLPASGDGAPPATMRLRTAFDHALELHELRGAAEAYASRHGEPGSPTYRAAWLRFRQQIESIEDLQRFRAASLRRKLTSQTTRAKS